MNNKENEKYITSTIRTTGLKHINTFQPCQDHVAVVTTPSSAVVTVADGHGSRTHYLSESGSRIACECVLNVFNQISSYETLFDKLQGLNSYVAEQIASLWQNEVICDFSRRCTSPETDIAKELVYTIYGTTLIYAATYKGNIFLGQIGDGTVIVRTRDGNLLEPLREKKESACPDSLCCDDPGELFRTAVFSEEDIDSVFLCTDGLVNHYDDRVFLHDSVETFLKTHEFPSIEKAYDDVSIAALWIRP